MVNYELYYDNTKDLPGTPSWIGEAPMGLTGSYVRPTLYNAGKCTSFHQWDLPLISDFSVRISVLVFSRKFVDAPLLFFFSFMSTTRPNVTK